MKALIDLDPLVYQYSNCCFPDGNLMPAYMAEEFCLRKIESIVERSGSDSWAGYLTFGPDNFRIALATIKPYKGNRKDREKPPLHDHIRNWLCGFDNVQMVFGMEADDALSIEQYKNMSASESLPADHVNFQSTIICTLDKDLDMVPGWHYRWSKGDVKEIEPWFQDELSGLRCFYKQCLTGDRVDNIPGLYGIGPKSSFLRQLDECDSEDSMFTLVLELYHKWYGNYAEQFLSEVGNLLWMKRSINDEWRAPTVPQRGEGVPF